ncbi:hypothetical protein Gogos_021374 [Gossypium gossypioides]|uniref:Uncharacterized protein n=1 Tax=Gossypium gossypioides TaxID=34282 RepID=A0A7J9D5W5_GOSGO|nr:hypothetical protein [Gossypium gossypioides]
MATSQKTAQQTTNGKLWNSSSEALTLTDKKVWQGSHYANFPEIIEDGDSSEFTHESVTDDADSHGSVAGSHYANFLEIIEDGDAGEFTHESLTDDADIPGSVAGLVYTDIQRQPIHWGLINTNLKKREKPNFKITKFGYNASIEIDAGSRPPTMKESFELEA